MNIILQNQNDTEYFLLIKLKHHRIKADKVPRGSLSANRKECCQLGHYLPLCMVALSKTHWVDAQLFFFLFEANGGYFSTCSINEFLTEHRVKDNPQYIN